MKINNVLWTGGFDSTYRIAELLSEGSAEVRPIYIIDRDRKSFQMELFAMSKLREMITALCGYECNLLPLEIYLKEDFSPCEEVRKAFRKIKSNVHIGSQYEWLAQFARVMKGKYGGFEFCMSKHNPPSILQMEIFADAYSGNTEFKHNYGRCLFENYRFPILHLTKHDMELNAKERGFYHILQDTWFCHWPVGELPCGGCNPCRIARMERTNIRYAFLGRQRRLVSAGFNRLKKYTR